MSEQQRQGSGDLTLTVHCAVFGTRTETIRRYKVGAVKPYAQYPYSVSLEYWLPRKRNRRAETIKSTIKSDNLQYYTVESGGRVLYDSRRDVPCNMEAWHETRSRRQPAIEKHARYS